MKSVMISINSDNCKKILNGKKTVEIKKAKPNFIKTPFKAYIYCTKSKPTLNVISNFDNNQNLIIGNGKIIAEFICEQIKEFSVPYPAYQNEMDKTILEAACTNYSSLHKYAENKNLFGWYISNLKIYKEPKELQEFIGLKQTRFGGMPYKLSRPPQTWLYVDK